MKIKSVAGGLMFSFLYHFSDHFWGKAVFVTGAAIAYVQVATMGATASVEAPGVDILRLLSIVSVALTIILSCTKLCPVFRRIVRHFSRRPGNQRTGIDRRKKRR